MTRAKKYGLFCPSLRGRTGCGLEPALVLGHFPARSSLEKRPYFWTARNGTRLSNSTSRIEHPISNTEFPADQRETGCPYSDSNGAKRRGNFQGKSRVQMRSIWLVTAFSQSQGLPLIGWKFVGFACLRFAPAVGCWLLDIENVAAPCWNPLN